MLNVERHPERASGSLVNDACPSRSNRTKSYVFNQMESLPDSWFSFDGLDPPSYPGAVVSPGATALDFHPHYESGFLP